MAFVVVTSDQATKALARSKLADGPVVLVRGFLRLALAENTGAAFGLFPGGRWLFVAMAAVLVPVLVYLYPRVESGWTGAGLGLVAGGAVGNLIDRFVSPGGAVTDFVEFSFWPTFNLADSALVVGWAILALQFLFGRRRRSEADADDNG